MFGLNVLDTQDDWNTQYIIGKMVVPSQGYHHFPYEYNQLYVCDSFLGTPGHAVAPLTRGDKLRPCNGCIFAAAGVVDSLRGGGCLYYLPTEMCDGRACDECSLAVLSVG